MKHYKGYFSSFIFIFVFLILKFSDLEILPDYFELQSNENISSYLLTIIGSIASFSGLLIAIILIAFEFYRAKSGAYLLQYFWRNAYIQFLISFNIYTLLICGLTLLQIKGSSPQTASEISLCYYSITLFFALIPVTIISFKKIADTLSVDYISKDLLIKLDFENDFYVKNDWTGSNSRENIQIEFIKNSPAYNLLKLISYSYLRNEEEVANQIINKFTKEFIEFYFNKDIKPGNPKYWDLQYFLAEFYLKIVSEAVVNPNLKINALHTVLTNINFLYSNLNERKFNLTLLRGLQFRFFHTIFDFEWKSDHEKLIALIYLKNLIINILYNSNLEENKIDILRNNFPKEYRKREYNKPIKASDFNKKMDQEKIQSDNYHELLTMLSYFHKMLDYCIKSKNEAFFMKILKLISEFSVDNWRINNYSVDYRINSDILHGHFLWKSFNFTSLNYSTGIKRGLIHNFHPGLLVSIQNFNLIFNKKRFYAKHLLEILMLRYKEAGDYGILTYYNLCGMKFFNGMEVGYHQDVNFTSIGVNLIQKINESEMHRSAMNLLLDTLEELNLKIKESKDEKLKSAPKDICVEIRERYNTFIKNTGNSPSQKLRKRLLKIINDS